jgi:hypothetical protein
MADDELTPEQKFAADDAETMVPRALLEGKPQEQIVADLIKLDYSPVGARKLVARIADELRRFRETPETREQFITQARNHLIAGSLLALVGIVFTIFTLVAAIAGATPIVVVAFGLIFGSMIVAGRGWSRWEFYSKLRDQLEKHESAQKANSALDTESK